LLEIQRNLKIKNTKLIYSSGDVLNRIDILEAIKDHDAVLITLGSGMSRKSIVRSRGTLNIINAMQSQGISRLICQSTLGAHESWSNLNFWWKHVMFGAIIKPVFKDHELQENLIHASGLIGQSFVRVLSLMVLLQSLSKKIFHVK